MRPRTFRSNAPVAGNGRNGQIMIKWMSKIWEVFTMFVDNIDFGRALLNFIYSVYTK